MTQVAASETATKPSAQVPRAARGKLPAAASGSIRLNTFQLLMRRWRALHPYNAGQAMRVSGLPDMERWRAAVTDTIRELGLGTPKFSDEGGRVSFETVEEVGVDLQETDICAFTNVEINRPFGEGELPIRFTVLPNGAAEESHLLVAIYDHWIADSRAMRELMHRIWERYRQNAGETGLRGLTLRAPHFNRLYRKHIGYLYRSRAMRECWKAIWRHRRAFRINLRDAQEFESHMIYTPLPDGLIGQIHTFAKKRDASVNDVFLAVLGQLMGQYTAQARSKSRKKKFFHFKRDQVGLGTIVDIRDAARQSLDQVFGLYLSSYTVVLDKPDQANVDTLTKVIAAKTKKIKRTNGAVKAYTALMMARLGWDLLPKFGRAHLQSQVFHKNAPVTAGISNVNMSKSWVDTPEGASRADGPVVLDYLRISPTGPLIPLVFTLTTIGDRLSLCCTYRTTAFNEQQARGLVAEFIERLGGVGT